MLVCWHTGCSTVPACLVRPFDRSVEWLLYYCFPNVKTLFWEADISTRIAHKIHCIQCECVVVVFVRCWRRRLAAAELGSMENSFEFCLMTWANTHTHNKPGQQNIPYCDQSSSSIVVQGEGSIHMMNMNHTWTSHKIYPQSSQRPDGQ